MYYAMLHEREKGTLGGMKGIQRKPVDAKYEQNNDIPYLSTTKPEFFPHQAPSNMPTPW